MNPVDIIEKYYDSGSKSYEILIRHGRQVAGKALAIAERVGHLNPDAVFIEEAAMLHDIGMIRTRAPKLGCKGTYPYVCHGYLGRQMLEDEGLPRHGLVCERHVGAGISYKDVDRYNLPIPRRNMIPVSIEEQIICYADKFFSKVEDGDADARSVAGVAARIRMYGDEQALRFLAWAEMFEGFEFKA